MAVGRNVQQGRVSTVRVVLAKGGCFRGSRKGRTELKCPSSDVPPEKGVIGIEYLLAILTTFWTSSVL